MKGAIIFLLLIFVGVPVAMVSYVYHGLVPPAKEAIEGMVYVSDVTDHWQSADESRIRGAGDCDDFTGLIAEKYYQLGIPFRVVIIDGVHAQHMVLQVGGVYVDSVRPRLIRITKRNQPLVSYTYKEFKRHL